MTQKTREKNADRGLRGRAAQAMLADDEWRWSAGYKAITSVWTEMVEDAERTCALGIAEHTDRIGEGGEVTRAIIEGMRAALPEVIAEAEDCLLKHDENAGEDERREERREVLAVVLCRSAAARECYMQVTDAMFAEARAARAA